jgi:hypothetical protein
MTHRSYRGVESLHNGTLEHTGHDGKAQCRANSRIMTDSSSCLDFGVNSKIVLKSC